MQSLMSSSPRMADRRVLIVALILGAMAAGLAVAYLSSQTETAPVAYSDIPVLVAARDLAVGTRITDEMIEVRTMPQNAVASDVLRDTQRAQAVGQTVRYPVAKGEQVGSTRLVGASQVSALSFQIPAGMRGFTIPVSQSESPASVLAPGDFVDVLVAGPVKDMIGPNLLNQQVTITTPLGTLVTRDVNGAQRLVAADQVVPVNAAVPVAAVDPETEVVVTLLQNVQVLSVERTFVANGVEYDPSVRGAPPQNSGFSYITLSLNPDQTQVMWLARQHGNVTLALRRFGENESREMRPVVGPLQQGR